MSIPIFRKIRDQEYGYIHGYPIGMTFKWAGQESVLISHEDRILANPNSDVINYPMTFKCVITGTTGGICFAGFKKRVSNNEPN